MSLRLALNASVVLTLLYSATSNGAGSPTASERDEAPNPHVRWIVAEDFERNDPHDPIVVNDKVIVGTDRGEVRAYQCKDGELKWVYEHGSRIFHRPCTDGKRVYFSSEVGIVAVNVEDGEEVWRLFRDHLNGPILVLAEEGMVYVGGEDGFLYALDAMTGEQTWVAEFIVDAPPDPPEFSGERARTSNTLARPSALASDGETLYLSIFDQCRIVAVKASDGKRLWSFQSGGWVFGSAVATRKYVFFGSQDKSFYCLDKETGRKVWSQKTAGRIESGGAVDEEFVYFGSCDGGLYCLNQSTGDVRWRFAADKKDDRNTAIYSVPILSQGIAVFAAGEGQAYAVDVQTGELRWKIRPSKDSELFCSPASDGETFFFVTRATNEKLGAPSLLSLGGK